MPTIIVWPGALLRRVRWCSGWQICGGLRRANTGVSPLRRKSAPPVEMTVFGECGGERSSFARYPTLCKAQRVGRPGSGSLWEWIGI